MESQSSAWQVAFFPAVIALAVTATRLAGELLGGPALLFGAEAGGGFALVGIAWLAPLFGVYFGLRLNRDGKGPAGPGKAVLKALLAVVAFFAVSFSGFMISATNFLIQLAMGAVAAVVGGWIAYIAWPKLGRILFAYGILSRIPVVVIMFFALLGGWGTHYDAPPPGYPTDLGFVQDFFLLAIVPQLTGWIGYTMAFGCLFGCLAAALAPGKRSQATA
ncbi:MAG: hypothetical protein ACE5JX_12900 [Acidobacteriota bacterium]